MGLRTLRGSAISICLSGGVPALVTLLSWAPALQAQITTGALNGTVTDERGNPLVGARVILESPALFQPKTLGTNAQGEYRALMLPVGNYTIKVFCSGHQGKTARDVRVGLGSDVSLSFPLKTLPPNACGTVEVVANRANSPVDVGCGGWGLNYFFTDLLPLDASFQRALALSPGATGTGLGTSLRGAHPTGAFNQVRYAIDGVDVSDPVGSSFSRQGSQGYLLEALPMGIEDEQVQLSTLNARYGGSLGGRVNLVTNGGSNSYAGALQLNISRPAWTTAPAQNAREGLAQGFESSASGPILKDRLWFALGLRQQPEAPLPFLQDSRGSIESLQRERQQMEGKVTGMITDSHTLSLALSAESGQVDTHLNAAGGDRSQAYQSRGWALTWNGNIYSNLAVEAQAATASRDHQRGTDLFSVNAKLFESGRGEHELDMGAETRRSFCLPNDLPKMAANNQTQSHALWINDIWTLDPRWCLVLGLRASRSALQAGTERAQDQSLEPRLQVKLNPDGRNREVYQVSAATFTGAYPSDLIPGPQSRLRDLKVPVVREFVLGYQRNYDDGFARLNLVQRHYQREFSSLDGTFFGNSAQSAAPRNQPGGRQYQAFEANWEGRTRHGIRFGGAYTLARTQGAGPLESSSRSDRDQVVVATLTGRWDLGRGFFGLGLLARYTDSESGSFNANRDRWSADLRVTTELAVAGRARFKSILQFENVFNQSVREGQELADLLAMGESKGSEVWKQPAMRGRTLARFSLGGRF